MPSLHETLRAQTRHDHAALDAAMSRFDLADPHGYRRFLSIHLAALTILVERCGDDDRDDVLAWMACLHHDLAMQTPARGMHFATNDGDRFDEAGFAYVIRGSRLGAALLLKRVGAGLPVRYLSCRPTLSWVQFLARLAALDRHADVDGTARAVASARSAFALFATAADAGVETT